MLVPVLRRVTLSVSPSRNSYRVPFPLVGAGPPPPTLGKRFVVTGCFSFQSRLSLLRDLASALALAPALAVAPAPAASLAPPPALAPAFAPSRALTPALAFALAPVLALLGARALTPAPALLSLLFLLLLFSCSCSFS